MKLLILVGIALATTSRHSAIAQSRAQPKASPAAVGTWRGTSTCLVRPSACNDEVVVFRSAAMKTADSLALDGRRITRGEEVEMGVLACHWLASSGEITCNIPQGVW